MLSVSKESSIVNKFLYTSEFDMHKNERSREMHFHINDFKTETF